MGRGPPCHCHGHLLMATWSSKGQPTPNATQCQHSEARPLSRNRKEKSRHNGKPLRLWKTQFPGPVRPPGGVLATSHPTHIPAQGARTPALTHSEQGAPIPAAPVMQGRGRPPAQPSISSVCPQPHWHDCSPSNHPICSNTTSYSPRQADAP